VQEKLTYTVNLVNEVGNLNSSCSKVLHNDGFRN